MTIQPLNSQRTRFSLVLLALAVLLVWGSGEEHHHHDDVHDHHHDEHHHHDAHDHHDHRHHHDRHDPPVGASEVGQGDHQHHDHEDHVHHHSKAEEAAHHDHHGHDHHGHNHHGHDHHGHDHHGHHHDHHGHDHHGHDHHGHDHGYLDLCCIFDRLFSSIKSWATQPSSMESRWLNAYISAFFMSGISFAGVGLLVLLKMPNLGGIVEYTCLAFAGTVLIADALLHLIPHALEGLGDHDKMNKVGLAATLGCLVVLAIPEIVEPHQHHHDHGHEQEQPQVHAYGYANLVTEMLHNFVDGISLGLSWKAGAGAGFATAVAVAVHELPQEIGDFMVLRSAGFPTGRLLAWNFLVSLTCVGGVAVVHYMGDAGPVQELQRYMTAFTAGSFLALSLNMIFPQVSESIAAYHKGNQKGVLMARVACLVLSGVAIWCMVYIGSLEEHDHSHHGHDHSHHGHGHSHGSEL